MKKLLSNTDSGMVTTISFRLKSKSLLRNCRPISQGGGGAITGYQNIVDRFFIAHIKDVAHIYVLPKNSTICKFRMALK